MPTDVHSFIDCSLKVSERLLILNLLRIIFLSDTDRSFKTAFGCYLRQHLVRKVSSHDPSRLLTPTQLLTRNFSVSSIYFQHAGCEFYSRS